MLEKIYNICSKINSEYFDVRYEKTTSTDIVFNGKELSKIGTNSIDGYVIRILRDGGFAGITVTRPEDIEQAVEIAAKSATLLGRENKNRTELKTSQITEDDVPLDLDEDPREISLAEKLSIVRHYNDLVLTQKDVRTTSMKYEESLRDRFFINSMGSVIHEPTLTTSIIGRIICRRGDLVQNGRVNIGGSDGFARIRNREKVFLDKTKVVNDLLKAQPVKGGTYNIILDPDMTGLFIHEAFGHFSEADLLENNPSLLDKMRIDAKLGSDLVDIIDDPSMKGQVGHYTYDDEGVRTGPVVLMEKGVLRGRLHSMKTAFIFGDNLTGHAVAQDARYEPIIRMGCIYLEPKEKSLEDLLKEAGEGLYILGAKGGETSGENFTFGAQYGFRIENGSIGPLVRDINIMGNLFSTLRNISAVSNSMEFSETGGCGKQGQLNIKSCYGGPHILIRDALVGGI
jgi:TldD protein